MVHVLNPTFTLQICHLYNILKMLLLECCIVVQINNLKRVVLNFYVLMVIPIISFIKFL